MAIQGDTVPWYKQRWPWLLMIGPGLVIVAGIVTAWLAIISNDGLVTDDYYKEGLAVNQQLQRDKGAAQHGLHGDLMRADLNLRLMLVSDAGEPLPDTVILKLSHPTLAGHDQSVKMTSEGAGFYRGSLESSIVGRWLVSAEDPAGEWRLQGEWKTGSQEPLRLSPRSVK